MKKMLFLINPRAGKTQIRTRILDILDIFVKAGYEVRVHVTQERLDAKNKVKKYGGKVDLVVCSGGDGTLNEAISGIMEIPHTPLLGYIPAGSTNDFASSLHLSKNMLTAARAAVEGAPYRIDIGRFCKELYFVYIAGFGIFTEVSYMTPQEKKNLLGHNAYMLEGVKSLMAVKTYQMHVISDEIDMEGEFIFGMVTNTISVGGFKGLVDQNVSLNDGQFEVLLIRAPKTPIEFSNIMTCLLLKEEQNEYVFKFRTKSLKIESQEAVDWVLDGEFGGSRTQVEIENLQERIQIMRAPAKK